MTPATRPAAGVSRRICLIVDHPARDLDGLTLLACELAARGHEVFLVPMYEAHEVFALAPDLVLVNYVRFANERFVKACRRLGIGVGVLDTEGGVRQDLDKYAEQVAPFVSDVQLYCVWGRAQYAALDRGAGLMPGALHATGCPRYDWSVAPWREAIAPPPGMKDPTILINTNFPLLRPRFQSREREIDDLVTKIGYERHLVMEGVHQTEHARAEVIRATIAIGEAVPSVDVVVRPHPFEDRQTYDDAFAGHRNIRVEQTGPVFQWLRSSRLMVHFNCSTAIDSMLLGVEPVHLDFIDAPLLAQPITASVSQRPRSTAELIDMARRAVSGERIAVTPELAAARRKVVEDYFFDDDGRSTVRVADAIASTQVQRPSASGLRYAADVLRAQGSMTAAAKFGVSAIGGAAVLDRVRTRMRRSSTARAKQFSAADVAGIVGRVAKVSPALAGMSVAHARSSVAAMPHLTGMRSVRVAAPPPPALRVVP